MPELPEVENVALALRAHLTGRRLTDLHIGYEGILRQGARATRKALIGRCIDRVHRHGKYIIINFSDGVQPDSHLMIHLRMTGQIFILDDYIPDKHVHLTFDFEGLPVHYRDVRKFGRLELVDHPEHPSAIAHVGPDMLLVRFREWYGRISHRRAPMKALLLDQGIASGLGNIYVDESLFLAGIHPLTKPVDLDEEDLREVWRISKRVLRNSIKHGGTTFMDFKDFYGKPGNFRSQLKVYGRAGQGCSRCGSTIEGIRIAGRSSCFCPECQPG
ncbi:MAG: bifunctional DNA-formamidopyrimidine glycosylase/DNA-(apurinic or apyrimidinic site) lyase [bacterium]|nr:bifunctional DNA-formamidopyrimidine glycosylase/DNA-(apurinic or apyrimidinic site) lyase [bacterium]